MKTMCCKGRSNGEAMPRQDTSSVMVRMFTLSETVWQIISVTVHNIISNGDEY